MSMLSESSAVITVNIFLHLYQYFYTYDNSPLKVLKSFALTTSFPLGVEWFFISVLIAIETRQTAISCFVAEKMEETSCCAAC